MKIYIARISRRLKNLREEKNLTQEELASELGISRQSIISVERGRCLPSLPLALRIAEMFHSSFEDLFLEKDSSKIKAGGEKIMPRQMMPWSPFSDIDPSRLMRAEADRFFESEDFPGQHGRLRAMAVPPVNVKQTEKDVILTADIPGVSEEDINIEIGDGFVDISGERKNEEEESGEGYYRKEVSYGSFSRRIPLPTEVITDKAEATIKEGQLKLVIPKKEPAKIKVTKVKIKK